MMPRTIEHTKGHPLKGIKMLMSKDYVCESSYGENLLLDLLWKRLILNHHSFYDVFMVIYVD